MKLPPMSTPRTTAKTKRTLLVAGALFVAFFQTPAGATTPPLPPLSTHNAIKASHALTPPTSTTTAPSTTTTKPTTTTSTLPPTTTTTSPPNEADVAASLRAATLAHMLNLQNQAATLATALAATKTEITNFAANKAALEAQQSALAQQMHTLQAALATAKGAVGLSVADIYMSANSQLSTQKSKALAITSIRQAAVAADQDIYGAAVTSALKVQIQRYEALLLQKGVLSKEIAAKQAQLNVQLPTLLAKEKDQAATLATTNTQIDTLAHSVGVSYSATDPWALTVLGPTTLTAQQITDWYTASGYVNKTGISTKELANDYVTLGQSAGVRGDVAFAQSILETAGFSIFSGKNNYAGIGACDSCHGGYNFATQAIGVRAQLELLHVYADATYTNQNAPGGPALPDLATVPVKGCCTTWPALTHVWATGTAYGEHILSIYLSMLNFALSDQPH